MRKLIAGCGYLGRRVATAWQAHGDHVFALTRSEEHAREFREMGLEPLLGDVTQPDLLPPFPKVDLVLYAIGYDRGSGQARRTVFVDGLSHLLNRIARRTKRFFYVSSTSVYGQDDGQWVDETSECHPTRPNGRICLEAEQSVWRYFPRHVTSDQPTATILRLSGIYGPGRLLTRIDRIRSGRPFQGNPEASLNLIHVSDAVTAVLACERHGTAGSVYLVSDDEPVTRRAYYNTLASCVGVPAVSFDNSGVESAEGNRKSKRCLNKKLHEELHVKLAYPSVFHGLRSAVVDQ